MSTERKTFRERDFSLNKILELYNMTITENKFKGMAVRGIRA
jgi:hypothetical protein